MVEKHGVPDVLISALEQTQAGPTSQLAKKVHVYPEGQDLPGAFIRYRGT